SVAHPRAQALCIIGFSYYLRRYEGATQIRERMRTMADALFARYEEYRSDDWEWCDGHLTYNSGRIPQALLLAGQALDEQRFVDCGLRSLHWLMKIHTTSSGAISLVGNRGWWTKGGERADFDQQPIDAAALVGACKSAYKVTGEQEWLAQMRRCFEWFLGRNILETPLVDFKTRGCCDGLNADGVNRNQGAESTLSWLLSLMIMHEMHPGEPQDHDARTA
ncbi:MAG: glycosyl transferase family 1, partial [Planctomycetes bacterium]|nr:glycosyl transferase family 1 [Planctomycetota bacterium]